MSLSEPKAKNNYRLAHNYPLPVILNSRNEIYKFTATYNGFCVEVTKDDDVRKLISMGYFGKANLSRSFPTFLHREKTEILCERQYKRRKLWGNNLKKDIKKVLIVPDSDSDVEIDEYLKELKPRYEIDRANVKEKLWLGFEETFFLSNAIKCLNINYNEKLLTNEELWDIFTKTDPLFQENYVAYFYYRSKNWVVKPGIKFGGDFLLYKEGPPFYHASYVIIIDILDYDLKRICKHYRRSMNHLEILGLKRLCETAGKELLICQIILPNGFQEITYTNLQNFEIREMTIKRWISSQERQADTT